MILENSILRYGLKRKDMSDFCKGCFGSVCTMLPM